MSEPTVPVRPRYRLGLRRVLDLLAIVAVAIGLLFVAWRQTRVPEVPETSRSRLSAPPTVVGTPHNFQHMFVHDQMCMVTLPAIGTREDALSELERSCAEVLKESASIVMPLEVSEREKDLLGQCPESARITSDSDTPDTAIYALPAKAGLIGVRFNDDLSLRSTRPGGRRNPGGSEEPPAPSTTPDAALGHRVICYGYVSTHGTSEHMIWFFRPFTYGSTKGSFR